METYDLIISSPEGNWTKSNGTLLSLKPILHRSLTPDQAEGLLIGLAFVRKERSYLLIKNSTEIVFNEFYDIPPTSEEEYREIVSSDKPQDDPYVGFISRINEEGKKIYRNFSGSIGTVEGVYEVLNLFVPKPETHLEVYENNNRYPLELINYPSLNPLQRIPREILYQIVDFLDPWEISRLCRTNSEYRDLSRDNLYWSRRLIRDLDLLLESIDELPLTESAFGRYREIHFEREIYRERKHLGYSPPPENFERMGYLGDILFALKIINKFEIFGNRKWDITKSLVAVGRGLIRSDNLKLFLRVFPQLVENYSANRDRGWISGISSIDEELIERILPDDERRYSLDSSLKILESLLLRSPNLRKSILIAATRSSSIDALDLIFTRYPEVEEFIPKLIDNYVRTNDPILFFVNRYGILFDSEIWTTVLIKVANFWVEDLPQILGNSRFPRRLISEYLDIFRSPINPLSKNERAAEILEAHLRDSKLTRETINSLSKKGSING